MLLSATTDRCRGGTSQLSPVGATRAGRQERSSRDSRLLADANGIATESLKRKAHPIAPLEAVDSAQIADVTQEIPQANVENFVTCHPVNNVTEGCSLRGSWTVR